MSNASYFLNNNWGKIELLGFVYLENNLGFSSLMFLIMLLNIIVFFVLRYM